MVCSKTCFCSIFAGSLHGVSEKWLIVQFLNFLQSQVRALNKDNHRQTRNVMIVGIPNVGKSALANSLHQIGRISALGDYLPVSLSILSIYLQHLVLTIVGCPRKREVPVCNGESTSRRD